MLVLKVVQDYKIQFGWTPALLLLQSVTNLLKICHLELKKVLCLCGNASGRVNVLEQ
jgi:hypothetical protein